MTAHLRGRDIVCLSNHYWDERRFRKQEFMSRFARANRVLYVEPSFSMLRAPEAHLRDVGGNRFFAPIIELRAARLWTFKPPRALPRWSRPRVEALTYSWYGYGIARAIRRLGFHDVLLWVYRPSYVHALEKIPHSNLVFDLNDDLTAYEDPGNIRFRYVGEMVDELVNRCDLLVTTAQTLADRYGPDARRTELVPNGFDRDLFSVDGARASPPALASIPRPRLGFVGTLFSFLDFELLERIAEAHSDKSVVLVGPVESSAAESVRRLARLSNVHHLGSVSQSEIPTYVEGFDVCLNVFRSGRASDSISPLKVFEYLAAGRPVVSTRMRALELEPVASVVKFADDAASFCSAVDEVLRNDGPANVSSRREAVEPYSWDRLFDKLDVACAAALNA